MTSPVVVRGKSCICGSVHTLRLAERNSYTCTHLWGIVSTMHRRRGDNHGIKCFEIMRGYTIFQRTYLISTSKKLYRRLYAILSNHRTGWPLIESRNNQSKLRKSCVFGSYPAASSQKTQKCPHAFVELEKGSREVGYWALGVEYAKDRAAALSYIELRISFRFSFFSACRMSRCVRLRNPTIWTHDLVDSN
jgi:hypothetical protein